MSFLAIDIGNTRLKWALYDRPLLGSEPHAQGAAFLETIDRLAEGDWARLEPPQRMLGCCVASDAVRHRVEEQLELWDVVPQWVVSSAAEGGVVNGYDHPLRLGSDRWVALIGARSRMQAEGRVAPVLVVMAGTAVTVDALGADGRFLGGLILPGHGLMLKALESGTAGLRVPTGEVRDFPTNTSDALTSGGNYAIAGAIERMHRHLRTRSGAEPVCMVAGGAGWKVVPALQLEHELVEHLIFDGLLALAAERSRKP
ncbi:MAG TPA: type III pantothenate kinase [Methylibium sp.]|uniref:type III pantothenate kinase n=1 Tax=Methylibium sp. TaxID=2067992 RepID=UPI002DBE1B48|nr:type III pantothenate kinase [Methylibium sp.]HEU4460928.1 type III pantothenate kinase [Methylibium sp.]